MNELEKAIAAIRAQGGTDADVESYVRSLGGQEVKAGPSERERGFRAAARTATNEAEQAALAAEPSMVDAWLQRAGGGLSSGLSMLPGGKLVQAGARSVARQQPFREALADINLAQDAAPAVSRLPAQAAGIVASIPLAPARAGGAAIGAGFGGATRLLSTENPDESISDRLLGTAGATAAGGLIGAALPTAMRYGPSRVAVGAATGGLLAGDERRVEGALAGGALAANPSFLARAASDATSRVMPAVSRGMRNISEATGLRGEVNRLMQLRQGLLTPLGGGVVGAGEVAAPTLLGARAAQAAASKVNYGTAAMEGDGALRAYQTQRGNIVDENVNRAFNIIRRDTEDAIAATHSATTAQARPTLREAMENFRVRSAEAARRQPPRTSESPFTRDVRAETSVQAGMRPAVDRRIAAEGPPPRVSTTADIPTGGPDLPRLLPMPPEVHPSVQRLYNNPRIAQVAAGLRKLSEFAGMEVDDPRLLDATYKVFSDQRGALAQRIEGATGVQPINLGRFTERDIQGAQQEILGVADEIMPTYRTAVEEHAKASGWMDAFRRGYSMVRTGSTAAKNLTQKSPSAVEAWAAEQTAAGRPELATAVRQGAREAMADVGAATPLDEGVAGILARGPFSTSPFDASKRRVAMGSGFDDFERTLADVREGAAQIPARLYLPGPEGHVATAAMTHFSRPVLERPAAQGLLGQITRDPKGYQDILAQADQGRSLLDVLQRGQTAQTSRAVGERVRRR